MSLSARARAFLTHARAHYSDVGFSAILGLQVLTVFIVTPLIQRHNLDPDVGQALRFGVAAIAILIVSRTRRLSLAVALAFAVAAAFSVSVRTGAAGQTVRLASVVVTIAFDAVVAWTVVHAAFDGGRISVHRILGAVILYLYVGLIFSGLYRLIAISQPHAFSGLARADQASVSELTYYSLGTLTTSGTGGLIPLDPLVRSLSNLEGVIGQLFPATLLARLVTLHGAEIERR